MELFTQNVMGEFTRDCKVDKLDLDSFIEVKKRQVGLAGSDNVNVNMKLPNELIEIYNEMNPSSKFDTSVRAGKFSGSVQKKRDRLNITNQIFTDTFSNSIEAIVRHLTTLLQTPLLSDVKMLLMVGGYSDSKVLQHAVKEAFPRHEVIAPDDGSLSIVKAKLKQYHNKCLHRVEPLYIVLTYSRLIDLL